MSDGMTQLVTPDEGDRIDRDVASGGLSANEIDSSEIDTNEIGANGIGAVDGSSNNGSFPDPPLPVDPTKHDENSSSSAEEPEAEEPTPFLATAIQRRKKLTERVAQCIFLIMTLALIVPLVGILIYLLVKAAPALSLSYLFENPKDFMRAGGVWAPLVGTFYLVFFSLLAAAPVGVLAGVYLNEFAPDNWFTRIINLAVVNLAGVPSIVHGLFGVGAFVHFAGLGRSVLAASCTLAIMTLPVIVTSTREALAAVPMSFREACWNMGATRWQTIRTIVLPNSISGILTGVILQVSRAAGETAPILFTGAVFYVAVADSGWNYFFPYSLNDRCMALSYHLFAISSQVTGVTEPRLFATATVLIGLVLMVNAVSITLRLYLRSKKKW